ncbi:hypothetical protein [Thermophilibacter sp.]
MPFCVKCGTQFPDGKDRCPSCGATVTQASATQNTEGSSDALISYKGTAKVVTIVAVCLAALAFLVYFFTLSGAQADYYDTVRDYSSLSSYAAQDFAAAAQQANIALLAGCALTGIGGFAGLLWALANLLMAYRSSR